jgi:hypothetical protein
VGAAPDRRRGRRVFEIARGRAADQAGDPGRYTPPKPGELRPEIHLQIGPIMQYVTELVKAQDGEVEPDHGIQHASG